MKYSVIFKTDILIRYLGKETSAAENKLVEDWCEESENNKDYFRKIKKLWDDTGDQSQLNEKYQSKVAFEKLFLKTGKFSMIRRFPVKLIAAASIILFLGLVLTAYQLWRNREIKFASEQQISSIKLKDNTIVWLNRNSTLTYTSNSQKERLVRLSGEAYFEVFPDAKRPFVILTSNSKITVVGTKFNVRASGNSETVVEVTSGVVNLTHLTRSYAGRKVLRLSAGEKGIINDIDSIPVKETMNNLNYISWKTRDFVFNNTNISEIVDLANAV
jgi:ferric-dicitrate binding protein FerR (iron transport regulator)